MIDFLINIFSNIGIWAYIFSFLLSFLENFILIGWLIPGTFLLAILLFLANLGFYNLYLIAILAFLGNYIGSLISYYLGYKLGKKSINKGFLFLSKDFFGKAKRYFNSYNFFSFILGKLVPGVKESISFLGGVFHINKFKISILLFIGSFLWISILVSIVYLFSFSFNLIEIWLSRIGVILFIIFFIVLLFSILRYYLINFLKLFVDIIYKFGNYLVNNYFSGRLKHFLTLHNKYLFTIPLFILFIYLVLAYSGFLTASYSNYILTYLDESLTNLFFYLRYNLFIYIFLFISYFGKFTTLLIIFFIFSLFLIKRKDYKYLFISFIVFILLSILVFLLKEIIQRPRPSLAVYIENGFSFPSAHVALGGFLFLLIFFYFFLKEKNWNRKVDLFLYYIIVLFLLSVSRIYLGVHFFSDVLASIILIAIFFIIFIILYFNLNLKYEILLDAKKLKFLYYIGFIFLFINLFLYSLGINFNKYESKLQEIYFLDKMDYFLKNKNFLYTTTIVGRKTEPINFIFLAKNDKHIEKLFNKAGFKKADKLSFKNIAKLGISAYDNINYDTAPFLPLFWNGQIQKLGFQKQVKNLKYRHHIRIWKTNFKYKDYNIYVASAVFDDGIKWKITHKIDPNIDKEREYFFNKLKSTNLIKEYKKIQLVPSIINGKNFSYDRFFTDGKAYILTIKD